MACRAEETYQLLEPSFSEDVFKKVEQEVFQKLKTDDNVDYQKLIHDPAEVREAEQAMRKTYDEVVHLMTHADSLDNALAHLPPERQRQIKTTFRLQSFRVDIKKQPDGSVNLLYASLTGEPLSFLPSVVKIDSDNYEENHAVLIARVILEVIFLVLDLVGLKFTPSKEVIAKAMLYIKRVAFASDKIIDDIKRMVNGASKCDDGAIGRAVVGCLCDLFLIAGTPILQIVKMIIWDMSWWQILITVIRVLCWCAAMVLTGGAAMVVKVIAWMAAATAFVMKLTQLAEYEGIRNSNWLLSLCCCH